MIVVDASVWVRALVQDGEPGDACRRVMAADRDWVVPAHAPLEVMRTIRRYEAAGAVTAAQATAFAAAVRDAEVRAHGPEPWLLDIIWTYRHNVSLYDAPYVALALRYDVPLVTLDQRLAKAARALGATVTAPAP